MQKLPDFVPAFSHHLKPLLRDGSQITGMLFHPRIDGGIALDSAVESQQFRSHRHGALKVSLRRVGAPAAYSEFLNRYRFFHHKQTVCAITDFLFVISENELCFALAEVCPSPETDLQAIS